MVRRVVITGIGVVSSVGCSLHELQQALQEGRSGIRLSQRADDVAPASARVSDFTPPAEWHETDRSIQFAIAAARNAAALCQWERTPAERRGVSVASSKGGVISFCKAHADLQAHANAPADWFANYWPSSPAAAVAAEFTCRGPTCAPIAACAAGSHALIDGASMIGRDEADIVLAGATEASIIPLICAGFKKLGVLANDGCCRPFDRDRSGFVIGEGAAIFLLEAADRAGKRGAEIFAEIAGWGRGADTGGIVAFEESGQSIAGTIRKAVKAAGKPAISYINAHATGTQLNDLIETRAIKSAFGSQAAEIPISGTKPITGHLLGAAGAVEAAICALAVKNDFIPPTLNLQTPGPECDLDYVPNTARRATVDSAMNLSFGFGGQIGVLILKKFRR